MKKVLKVLLVLAALCLVLTGCSGNKPADDPAGTPDEKINGLAFDCTEYTSLDEMNAAAGTAIAAPGEEKTDEKFEVISGSIAQYTFKLNENEEWCVRASKDVDNDISGLYYDSIGFEKDINSTYYTDDVYLFRFFYEDVQYVVMLDTKDKDFSTKYCDDISSEIKTNITGVESGYETELLEEGDDVIYRATFHNDDGTAMIMEIIYSFENDKMVSILNRNIFETEEAAKAYYDELIASGTSEDEMTLEGAVISADMSANVEFYSDYTKEEFAEMMKASIA